MEPKRILAVLCLIVTLFATTAHGHAAKPCHANTTCFDTLSWQGMARQFTYYLPTGYTDNRRYHNLVIALHDTDSTGYGLEQTILKGQFDRIADKTRTIVVYPDAVNGTWNNGTPNSTAAPTDDVGFIRALIEYFKTNYYVNPNRIYVMGMSDGGVMAFRLACESADIITAIATVTASMPPSLASACKPTRPISVLMMNGTHDPLLPWNGHALFSLTGTELAERLSVPETFNAWLTIDDIHTSIRHAAYTTANDGTWAWVATANNSKNTAVTLYTIYGGGHAWPGGTQYLPTESIGKASDIDGSMIIWQFLISHRLVPIENNPFPGTKS